MTHSPLHKKLLSDTGRIWHVLRSLLANPAVNVNNHVFRFDERAIPQLDMTAALRIARYNEYLSNGIRRRPVFSTSGAPDRCHQTATRRSHSSIPFFAPRSGHAKWLQALSDRSHQALCELSSRPLVTLAPQPRAFENVEAVLAGADSRFDFPLLAHFAVDHQPPASPPKTTTKKESV